MRCTKLNFSPIHHLSVSISLITSSHLSRFLYGCLVRVYCICGGYMSQNWLQTQTNLSGEWGAKNSNVPTQSNSVDISNGVDSISSKIEFRVCKPVRMDHNTIDICMFYNRYNANVSCNSSMNNTIRMGNSTNRYTFLPIVDKTV